MFSPESAIPRGDSGASSFAGPPLTGSRKFVACPLVTSQIVYFLRGKVGLSESPMERNERPEATGRSYDEARESGIRAQVERLAVSPTFASAPRRVRLLRYLVERTLAGAGDQVNEYSIGVDVLEKMASFDPRSDSMVRTDVMRLRQRLRQYYVEEGRADPLVLDLPARSY